MATDSALRSFALQKQATKSEISDRSSQNYSIPKCDFPFKWSKPRKALFRGIAKYDFLVLFGSADKFKAKYIPFVIRCQ